MFNGCSSLTSLDVGSWSTGSVTDMQYMFNGCSSLNSLNVSSWNTGSVEYMDSMFNGCSSLTALDLSGWNTGSVTDMGAMFYRCSALSSLTLGENFSFVSGTNCALPDVLNDSDYTGKWINQTDGLTKTSQELMRDYNGATMAGTWVWQLRIDISGATVDVADQVYTGGFVEPAVTVTLNGTELQKDRDYAVDYQNNTAPGTATVIITGIHDYKGQAFGSFEIVGAPKPGLNFFQKIVQFFKNLFAKIKAFFEGLKK